MSEEKDQLHHCERCAAVFSAPPKVGLKVVCSACGESPVVSQGFTSRARAERVVDTDEVHGVAGKDVADFVSVQKVRRQKQMRMAIILWAVLLAAVPSAIFYFNGKQREEADVLIAQNKKESEAYKLEREEGVGRALQTFYKYLEDSDANRRSALVVGGVRQILKLQADIADLSADRLGVRGKVENVEYYPDGEYPRVELILSSREGRRYEVVLWEIEGEWKFDWEQHVRYSQESLKRFLDQKSVGGSAEFRLYVRRRYSSSMKQDQDLQLLFYQPSARLGDRFVESPQVVLKPGEPLYADLNEAFENVEARKEESVVGSEDPEGLLRVRATLSFVKGEDGEQKLALDKISAYHWMAFEPGE